MTINIGSPGTPASALQLAAIRSDLRAAAYFGSYASKTALETSYPASSNPGAAASIGGALYLSDGVSWNPILTSLQVSALMGALTGGTVTATYSGGKLATLSKTGGDTLTFTDNSTTQYTVTNSSGASLVVTTDINGKYLGHTANF